MGGVRVGNFVIQHPNQGKVWINFTDGNTAEGAQFDVAELVEALEKFWAERF